MERGRRLVLSNSCSHPFLRGKQGTFFSLNWRFWLKKGCSAVKQEGGHISYVLPGSSVSLLSQLGPRTQGKEGYQEQGQTKDGHHCGLSVPSL